LEMASLMRQLRPSLAPKSWFYSCCKSLEILR
jgi:hypothetical protein